MLSNTDDRIPAGAAGSTSPAPAYETRDASTNGVLGFLVVLFAVINLILFGTWRLFRHFSVAEQPPAPASSFANVRQVPPRPELQVNGREDFQEMYAAQRGELETYAWQDRKAGVVRIPIDRAMDVLLQKGLPVLPQAPAIRATTHNAASPEGGNESGQPGAALEQSVRGGDR